MKKYKNHIVGFLVFASLVFLYGFAGKRNNARNVNGISISFTNEENLYITENAVNNLLIQKEVAVANVGKDILDLNRVEKILDTHEMIENAEVYLTVDGELGARITQRKPLGRILASNSSFYVDATAKKMPLSPFHSARVPIVLGVDEKNIAEVHQLLDYIEKDDFLKHHITAIQRQKNGFYKMQLREMDFELLFGVAGHIDLKFNNFKAFYQNGLKNNKLNLYKTVNLQFGNQVVATKK
ncbi:MAG TPA: hypothetical protein VFM70_08850 [Salinimicrobium sp.]|nr:hypothetical protein [Salinimicrobium sp.]